LKGREIVFRLWEEREEGKEKPEKISHFLFGREEKKS
jgi:hypothetical protein